MWLLYNRRCLLFFSLIPGSFAGFVAVVFAVVMVAKAEGVRSLVACLQIRNFDPSAVIIIVVVCAGCCSPEKSTLELSMHCANNRFGNFHLGLFAVGRRVPLGQGRNELTVDSIALMLTVRLVLATQYVHGTRFGNQQHTLLITAAADALDRRKDVKNASKSGGFPHDFYFLA